MRMTATQFRQDLFKTLDRVAQTGEPLEIERNGALLRLQVVEAAGALLDLERFANRRSLLKVPAAALVSSDWSGLWRPEGGFAEGPSGKKAPRRAPKRRSAL
jgi:hypothetical protein